MCLKLRGFPVFTVQTWVFCTGFLRGMQGTSPLQSDAQVPSELTRTPARCSRGSFRCLIRFPFGLPGSRQNRVGSPWVRNPRGVPDFQTVAVGFGSPRACLGSFLVFFPSTNSKTSVVCGHEEMPRDGIGSCKQKQGHPVLRHASTRFLFWTAWSKVGPTKMDFVVPLKK